MIQNNLNTKGRNRFFVFDNLLGDSNWARHVRRRIIQPSSHRYNALVCGPSGSGKLLIARSLHEHGPRSSQPFVPVNCRTLPTSLFRGQVFGRTHRETTTLGCMRAANGGTLYLANVDRLSLDLQGELLDVLDTKSVSPVGGSDCFSVDFRLVTSAEQDLDLAVREGRFRADLFGRLSVLNFETKPLSERLEDVEKIATHLVAKLTFERGLPMKSLAQDALDLLCAYSWPGNVTELREKLDAAISETSGTVIRASELGIDICELRTRWETLADVESRHIRETLAITRGDVGRAAALLGIDAQDLSRKLGEQFG